MEALHDARSSRSEDPAKKRSPTHAREPAATADPKADLGGFLRDILQSTEDAIIGKDLAGIIISWNPGAERLYGYTASEAIGRHVMVLVPEGRVEEEQAILERVARGERVTPYDTERKRKDGKVIPVSLTVSPVRTASGGIVGMSAIARSILERKKAAGMGEFLQNILQSTEDAIIGKDLSGTIVSWNPGAQTLYGYSATEAIGRPIMAMVPEGRVEEEQAILERVARGERVTTYDTERKRKDGSLVPVSLTVSPVRSSSGEIIGMSAIARSTLERKRAAGMGEFLQNILQSTEDAIIGKSLEGNIVSWNPGADRLYGYSAEEAVGRPVMMLVPEARLEEERAILARVVRGERVTTYETERKRKDGSLVPVSLTVSPVRDERGFIVGMSAIARSISEQKKADELRRTSAAYARSLIEASLDPLVTISPDGKITDVNRATELVTGMPRGRLVGTDFSGYFAEPEKAREGYRLVFSQGSVRDYPLTIRHTSGSIIHVLYNATVYRDDKGNVLGVFAAARDVSERKKSEALQEAASSYARSLIEASLDPLVTISPDGKITDVNEATVRITAMPRERLIGTDFSEYFTEPDKAREGYKEVFAKGSVTDYPLTVRASTGRLTHVLYNASVYKDVAGNVLGVFAAARDITAQRQASQYARSLIEASLDPLVTISPDGKITDVNDATVRVTGVQRERLIATDFSDYFTEPEKARQGYREVFSRGFVTDYPLTIRHASGRLTDVLYNATVYKDDKGNVLGVFAAARDVTERRQAEEKQRVASQYARSLIEASLDPLVTISPDGKITDVNEATEMATGVPRALLIATDFSDYFLEPDKAREGYRLAFSQGSVRDYPLAIRHRSGTVTDVLYNATVYKDEHGKVQGVFAAARDVTERKKADALRQAASSYARSLIEASLDPLVTISPDGKIRDVNRATEAATGLPREMLVGTDFSDYFADPDKAREGYKEVFARGAVTDYPLAIRNKTGRVTEVLYNAAVFRDQGGQVQGVFAAARDVTEQRRLQTQLEQRNAELVIQNQRVQEANRLKSEFLASMSHELRTPLNGIIGFTEFLMTGKAGEVAPTQREYLTDVLNSGRHLLQLINDVLDLAKVESGKMELSAEEFAAAPAVSEVCSVLRPLADAKHIKVSTAVSPALLSMRTDPRRFKQILYNLLSNGIKFTDDGGRVDVAVSMQDPDRVELRVRDTGIGIRKEDMSRLFVEFEQLDRGVARKYEGSGLGLALTRKLVEMLGGTIAVDSEPGRGSTFTVVLPAGAPAGQEAPAP